MIWFIAAGALILVIAVAAMRWVNRELSHTAASAVYDLGEATDWIAERLPEAVAAKLSFDDVKAVLLWHLAFLRSQGMATFGGVDLEAQSAAVGGKDVVAHEDQAVDAVVASAAASERDIDEVDVVVVLELNNDYLHAIGALGVRKDLAGE